MSKQVIFHDERGKFYHCKNVREIRSTSDKSVYRQKADLIVVGDEIHNISVKKDNAEYWESADSYYANNAKMILTKLIDENKIEIVKEGNIYKISNPVAVYANTVEKELVVFGNDISNNGMVMTRSFSNSDFKSNSSVMEIKTTSIMEKIDDIPENSDVYFFIRNDSTRQGSKIFPGIRVLAAMKNKITNNTLVVDSDFINN